MGRPGKNRMNLGSTWQCSPFHKLVAAARPGEVPCPDCCGFTKPDRLTVSQLRRCQEIGTVDADGNVTRMVRSGNRFGMQTHFPSPAGSPQRVAPTPPPRRLSSLGEAVAEAMTTGCPVCGQPLGLPGCTRRGDGGPPFHPKRSQ